MPKIFYVHISLIQYTNNICVLYVFFSYIKKTSIKILRKKCEIKTRGNTVHMSDREEDLGRLTGPSEKSDFGLQLPPQAMKWKCGLSQPKPVLFFPCYFSLHWLTAAFIARSASFLDKVIHRPGILRLFSRKMHAWPLIRPQTNINFPAASNSPFVYLSISHMPPLLISFHGKCHLFCSK